MARCVGGGREVRAHGLARVRLMSLVGLVCPELAPGRAVGLPLAAVLRPGPADIRTGLNARPGPAVAALTAQTARTGPAALTASVPLTGQAALTGRGRSDWPGASAGPGARRGASPAGPTGPGRGQLGATATTRRGLGTRRVTPEPGRGWQAGDRAARAGQTAGGAGPRAGRSAAGPGARTGRPTGGPGARTGGPGARTGGPGARTGGPGARTGGPGARTGGPGARTGGPGPHWRARSPHWRARSRVWAFGWWARGPGLGVRLAGRAPGGPSRPASGEPGLAGRWPPGTGRCWGFTAAGPDGR